MRISWLLSYPYPSAQTSLKRSEARTNLIIVDGYRVMDQVSNRPEFFVHLLLFGIRNRLQLLLLGLELDLLRQ